MKGVLVPRLLGGGIDGVEGERGDENETERVKKRLVSQVICD